MEIIQEIDFTHVDGGTASEAIGEVPFAGDALTWSVAPGGGKPCAGPYDNCHDQRFECPTHHCGDPNFAWPEPKITPPATFYPGKLNVFPIIGRINIHSWDEFGFHGHGIHGHDPRRPVNRDLASLFDWMITRPGLPDHPHYLAYNHGDFPFGPRVSDFPVYPADRERCHDLMDMMPGFDMGMFMVHGLYHPEHDQRFPPLGPAPRPTSNPPFEGQWGQWLESAPWTRPQRPPRPFVHPPVAWWMQEGKKDVVLKKGESAELRFYILDQDGALMPFLGAEADVEFILGNGKRCCGDKANTTLTTQDKVFCSHGPGNPFVVFLNNDETGERGRRKYELRLKINSDAYCLAHGVLEVAPAIDHCHCCGD